MTTYVESMPGMVDAKGLAIAVAELYRSGLPPGAKTGWPSLDRHFSVVPGQVTIITGWPGAGKSEFLDALLVNLMHQGWKSAIYSPENQPIELHAAKLLEKLIGKPFGHGPTERMTWQEAKEVLMDGLDGHMAFARVPEDGSLSPSKVIETCEPWLAKHAASPRALVMDPWNELEHWRPANLSETEYVSMTLQRVRSWARANEIHVFIVAHPQKMRRDPATMKLPVPTLDMISGSQHWWNKADCGLVVHREPGEDGRPREETDVYVQKIRFKHVGKPGLVTLAYDKVTGRYRDTESDTVAWNDLAIARKKREEDRK